MIPRLEALLARGAIDEAAFVLAELLGDADGAVSLLEEHGRLEQAARLAESRELRPAGVVRLWLLARDPERAIVIARRHDAFADAVTMLRHEHPALARALALRWADILASGGDDAGAVDAVSELPEAGRVAATWIDRAVAHGGVVGARMLARRATLLPERYAETRDARSPALTRRWCSASTRATVAPSRRARPRSCPTAGCSSRSATQACACSRATAAWSRGSTRPRTPWWSPITAPTRSRSRGASPGSISRRAASSRGRTRR